MSTENHNSNNTMQQYLQEINELRNTIQQREQQSAKAIRQIDGLIYRHTILQDWLYTVGVLSQNETITPDAIASIISVACNGIAPPEGLTTLRQFYDFYFSYGESVFIKRMMKNAKRWGYVYLMNAPIVKLYKIGFSEKPEKRAKGLSQSLPKEMHSVEKHRIMTDDMVRLEAWFHDTLKEYRHDGEWFKLNEVQIEEITSMQVVFFQRPQAEDSLLFREKTLQTARAHWLPVAKGTIQQKRLLD